jgi:hypothetical protein
VKVADVVGVLPGDAIGVCYRDALKGGAFAGKAMLHLEFAKGETKASCLGDSSVSRLSACVEGAARGIVVNGGGEARGSADVDLMFVGQ